MINILLLLPVWIQIRIRNMEPDPQHCHDCQGLLGLPACQTDGAPRGSDHASQHPLK